MNNSGEEWLLSDSYEPNFMWTGEETVRIASSEHLAQILVQLSQKEPRLALLKSPLGALVAIATGGPLSVVQFYNTPHSGTPVTAKPSKSFSEQDAWFVAEGQPVRAQADTLIPIDKMIEIVSHIYRKNQLPTWIDWV